MIRTGGSEGKLLQDVFPYRYTLWDVKFQPKEALLSHPSALSPFLNPRARSDLWRQWRRFWRPSSVFVDKSPENLFMAPFLQDSDTVPVIPFPAFRVMVWFQGCMVSRVLVQCRR